MTAIDTDNWPRTTSKEILSLLVVLSIVLLAVTINRIGYQGYIDDSNYLAGARGWLESFPFVSENHWQNRHPLVLSIALSFAIFGENELALTLPSTLYFVAFVVVLFQVTIRLFDLATAIFVSLIAGTSPLLSVYATTAYPLSTELFFYSSSVLIFIYIAEKKHNGATLWLVISGLSLGLAYLVRESAVSVGLAMVLLFLFNYGPERKKYAYIALGFFLVLLIEGAYFEFVADEFFYRYQLLFDGPGHRSAHIIGDFADRNHFFNFDRMAAWVPNSPFPVHWTVDPFINFFVDEDYGLLYWLAVPLTIGLFGGKGVPKNARRIAAVFLLFGILAFIVIVYVLSARPQPRYFGFLNLAVAVNIALALRYWLLPKSRTVVALCLAALVATNYLLIDLRPIPNYVAKQYSLAVNDTDEPIYADQEIVDSADFYLDNDARKFVRVLPAPEASLLFVIGQSNIDAKVVTIIVPQKSLLLIMIRKSVFADWAPPRFKPYLESRHPTVRIVRTQ